MTLGNFKIPSSLHFIQEWPYSDSQHNSAAFGNHDHWIWFQMTVCSLPFLFSIHKWFLSFARKIYRARKRSWEKNEDSLVLEMNLLLSTSTFNVNLYCTLVSCNNYAHRYFDDRSLKFYILGFGSPDQR